MFGHNDDEHKDENAGLAPGADTNNDGGLTLPSTPPADGSASHNPSTPIVGDDALLKLKREALEELAPLVDHLEQTPEEKFKTTMMMIQATDDSKLIKEAYAAAKSIESEKSRAQALLDIVNEINYFTQQHAD